MIERNLLADIVRDTVTATVGATVSRHAEQVAEKMANEILSDPETRTRLLILVRAAFDHAIAALNEPKEGHSE